MKVIINKYSSSYIPQMPDTNSSYDKRIGAWARVHNINSVNNSVDVFLDTGVFLEGVPVASREWVRNGADVDLDYNTGERDLPPVESRVFVLMPSQTFDDCFVLPISSFNTVDANASSPFLGEGIEKIKERITPSKWHVTDNYVTGSHMSVSPDKKTSLEIDYGTEDEPKEDDPELHLKIFDDVKVDILADDSMTVSVFDEMTISHKKDDSYTVKIFDTEMVIKKGEVFLKPKDTTIEVEGNATLKTTGNTEIEATGNVSVKGVNVDVKASATATINSAMVKVTGGSLQVNGTVAPGSGPFCALPACLFTGAPHGGNIATGT
jgi:hypothetical protein